jgi:catechol 2,3-dioxygenase
VASYDYVLVNDDLDRTYGDLKAILPPSACAASARSSSKASWAGSWRRPGRDLTRGGPRRACSAAARPLQAVPRIRRPSPVHEAWRAWTRAARRPSMSAPETLLPLDEPGAAPARPIDPGVRIGHVHLKVADLDRALAFYCGVLGFALMQRYGTQAAFVAAGAITTISASTLGEPGRLAAASRDDGPLPHRDSLSDAPGARGRPAPPGRGPHHPRRASDHGVSEALYLRDPGRERGRALLGPPGGAMAAHPGRSACHAHRPPRPDGLLRELALSAKGARRLRLSSRPQRVGRHPCRRGTSVSCCVPRIGQRHIALRPAPPRPAPSPGARPPRSGARAPARGISGSGAASCGAGRRPRG